MGNSTRRVRKFSKKQETHKNEKRGVEAFLSIVDRPKKRALQKYYYKKIGNYFKGKPISVLDLPSLYLDWNLEAYNEAGINISHYTACENNTFIANKLRENHYFSRDKQIKNSQNIRCIFSLQKRNVFKVLSTSRQKFSFLNLDFCHALGSSWESFSIPGRVDRVAEEFLALILTVNPRSPSKPCLKVEHALEYIFPIFYNFKPVLLEK